MELFKLYGSVFVETSEAQRKISQTVSKAKSMGDAFTGAQKDLKSLIKMLEGTAVVAAVAGAFKLASETAEHLDIIAKASRTMGVSSDWYQQWEYIAQICGTNIDTITRAVETMNTKVGNASDSTVEAFGELRISMIDAQNMAPEDLFELVVSRLGEIDSASVKAKEANDIFGGSWKDLSSVTELNAQAIDGLKSDYQNLTGGPQTQEATKAAEDYNDALTRLHTVAEDVKTDIGVQLMPKITPVINKITDFLVWLQKNGPAAFQGIRDAIVEIKNVLSTGDIRSDTSAKIQNAVIAHGYSGTGYNPDAVVSRFAIPALDGRGSASGLDYAPYDRYPVRLHRGEAVVSQTDSQRPQGWTVTQIFQDAPKSDAEKAAETAAFLERARWLD